MKEPTLSNRGQMALLAGLVLLFAGVILVAPFLDRSPLAKTSKKLRAKPGTERAGARALVSEKATRAPAEQRQGTRDKPLAGWDAPKNWDRLRDLQEPATSESRTDLLGLSALPTAEGIAVVKARLEGTEPIGAVAQLYAALGGLHAQQDPPDIPAAVRAYDLALASAVTPEERHEILHSRIEALHQQSEPRDILAVIDAGVDPDEAVTLPFLELEILRATALEKLNHIDEAEDVYRSVLDHAQTWEGDTAHAEEVYRQAAMRLARLYRGSGREEDAEAVAREVRKLSAPVQLP